MTDLPDLRAFVVRPTLPLDREDVLAFCERIWEGHDYIPYVWEEWLADPDGRMFTLEYGGHAVGLGRLTWMSPGQWWLEGLRVHPDFHDRGLGAQLHDFLNHYWDEHGDGWLRLTTHRVRVKVQHLCDRSGYVRLGELTAFGAPATHEPLDAFEPLSDADVNRAVEFALSAPSRALGLGLNDFGWQHGLPNARGYGAAIAKGRAWWWRGRRGLLVAWDDTDSWEADEQPVEALMVSGLACALEDAPALLRDMTALAGSLGKARAAWVADIGAGPLLAQAGFRRIWDDSLYIYERAHPCRRGGQDVIVQCKAVA